MAVKLSRTTLKFVDLVCLILNIHDKFKVKSYNLQKKWIFVRWLIFLIIGETIKEVRVIRCRSIMFNDVFRSTLFLEFSLYNKVTTSFKGWNITETFIFYIYLLPNFAKYTIIISKKTQKPSSNFCSICAFLHYMFRDHSTISSILYKYLANLKRIISYNFYIKFKK